MACRISLVEFYQIAMEERDAAGFTFDVGIDETPEPSPMATYECEIGTVVLRKKPIQALVDESEQARPIIRNLLRWADEARCAELAHRSA